MQDFYSFDTLNPVQKETKNGGANLPENKEKQGRLAPQKTNKTESKNQLSYSALYHEKSDWVAGSNSSKVMSVRVAMTRNTAPLSKK